MTTALALLLLISSSAPGGAPPGPRADTLRLEIGSPEVDGRVFPAHRARNRVYPPGATLPSTTWTNELLLGDSAGVPVMRWITRGEQLAGGGATWELLQTWDARTMAPLAYGRSSSAGGSASLRFDGARVSGVTRAPGDPAGRPLEVALDRPAFVASASDMIPLAVGVRPRLVMTAPVWGPGMDAPEVRVFTVFDRGEVAVEGAAVTAWKVEERVEATGRLVATWYLTETSPYMVLGEVALPDGRVQRITGVALEGG